MASLWSSCPDCMHSWHPSGPAGTSSLFFNLPAWATEFVCHQCGIKPWFQCGFPNCAIPSHKNLFRTLKLLRLHAQYWHGHRRNVIKISDHAQNVDPTSDFAGVVDSPEYEDTPPVTSSCTYGFAKRGTAQFAEWCIDGSVIQAVHCLVQQSLYQAPISLDLNLSSKLPPHSIQLFLRIAKMLLTTGQSHHSDLSNILVLLMSLIPPDNKEWPTMPSTIAGFQSHILNPTNQHSLVSILPIPTAYMLPDKSHAYCCIQEISAFVLLLPRTIGASSIPLRLRQLCECVTMQEFLRSDPNIHHDVPCLVSLGLIFWLDGWDPSASSKNNRSPVHTASVTILFIDNSTRIPFNALTFPIACGPGKADHNTIFVALKKSLNLLTAGNDVVWSHHHGRWTTLRAHLIAFLMDQPERRGTNCLLGGNSKQHALFGISCNFDNLERQFSACPKCLRAATRYLEHGHFETSMIYSCRICYGFSLSRLLLRGKYSTPSHSKLSVDTPGYGLTDKPGILSFELLIDAWQYAIRKFVHDKHWNKEQVKAYFSLLCINKASIDNFTLSCTNYLLCENIAESPDDYDEDMVAYVEEDRIFNPILYQVPPPPAAWGIGTISQRVETIMHLAMNTQKAILHWAAASDHGKELKKRLDPLVESVQELRPSLHPLSYIQL